MDIFVCHWQPSIDLTELDLPSTMQTHFVDPSDLLNFTLTITPDEGKLSVLFSIIPCRPRVIGMYKGGAFKFSFAINTNYPHDPPKVKCIQKVSCRRVIWLEDNVCSKFFRSIIQMSILRAMYA